MGRQVPTTEEPCDGCGTTEELVFDFMGDYLCNACIEEDEKLPEVPDFHNLGDPPAEVPKSLLQPPVLACSSCLTAGGYLLSESGTDDCSIWYCIRCYIKEAVKEEIAKMRLS